LKLFGVIIGLFFSFAIPFTFGFFFAKGGLDLEFNNSKILLGYMNLGRILGMTSNIIKLERRFYKFGGFFKIDA
jgi:hypothetical protein